MSKKSATISLPYIGGVLSVNRYKFFGGRYRKPEVRQWMAVFGYVVNTHHIEDWRLPLVVTCSGRFRDKRSQPDLSNLSKVILDAIEDATGINDANFRWRDGDITIDKSQEPTLFIIIEEATCKS